MFEGGRTYKLETGLELLEEWADSARQVQKNLLYKALFCVIDGSVFRFYGALQDAENPRGCFVLIREDLVLKISYGDADGFGIEYIGTLDGAPGLDLALELAGSGEDRL